MSCGVNLRKIACIYNTHLPEILFHTDHTACDNQSEHRRRCDFIHLPKSGRNSRESQILERFPTYTAGSRVKHHHNDVNNAIVQASQGLLLGKPSCKLVSAFFVRAMTLVRNNG